MLIFVDMHPRIKLLHVTVDVILFAAKRLDLKDVTGHYLVNNPRGWSEWGVVYK